MSAFIYAALGGFIPACIWLWFWLKEDVHPEPRRMLIAAFIGGILMVPAALFFENLVTPLIAAQLALFTVWAAIEEVLKYAAAHLVAFRKTCLDKTRCIDEPIDPLIYMVTVALGFAAAENALFLLTPITNGEILAGFVTGNLRFVGAMVLHVAASASVGIAMGLAYHASAPVRYAARAFGLFTAIALHALFNIFILMSNQGGIFIVFAALWIAVIVLFLVAERVKQMKALKAHSKK